MRDEQEAAHLFQHCVLQKIEKPRSELSLPTPDAQKEIGVCGRAGGLRCVQLVVRMPRCRATLCVWNMAKEGSEVSITTRRFID